MDDKKFTCPKCGKNEQILVAVDIEGGHRTNWTNRTEFDFARALLFVRCLSCGHNHELKIEWQDF